MLLDRQAKDTHTALIAGSLPLKLLGAPVAQLVKRWHTDLAVPDSITA